MSSIVAARHGASLLYSIHTLYSMIIGVTHATTVTLSYLILIYTQYTAILILNTHQ